MLRFTSKRSFWIIGILVLLLAGGILLYSRFADEHPSNSKEGTSSKKAIYYCPMHPTYTSDRPGQCPICNMTLVLREDRPEERTPDSNSYLQPDHPDHSDHPVEEPEKNAAPSPSTPEGYAAVSLTPQKQQLIGIRTESAILRHLQKTIRTVGTVAHDPDLYQAQAEYISALEAQGEAKKGGIPEIVAQTERLVESTETRLHHLGLSDALIAEIAERGFPEKSLIVHDPDHHPIWIYAKVYEYEIPAIKIGQAVTVEVAATGALLQGEIRSIDTLVDPTTRTTRIRAQIPPSDQPLRPDTYVNVSISVDLGEVLAIPSEAVIDTGTRQIIFVEKDKGLFEPRNVTLGSRTDEFYEVKSGVQAGEKIVTSGNFLIDSESRLKGAIEGGKGGDVQHVH